jgi:hypothetical protein
MVLSFIFVNAQSKTVFEAGSFIVHNSISEEVKNAKTILFVISGEFDNRPPKATFEKRLKRIFENANLNVTLVYWNFQLNQLSNPNIKTTDFDVAILLSQGNHKILDSKSRRKKVFQEWNIIAEKGSNAQNLGTALIEVYAKKYTLYEDRKFCQSVVKLLL